MSTVAEPDTITLESFTRLVLLHCRLSGHEPDPAVLEDWLTGVWQDVVDDMDPVRWARAYRAGTADLCGSPVPM